MIELNKRMALALYEMFTVRTIVLVSSERAIQLDSNNSSAVTSITSISTDTLISNNLSK